MKSIDTSRKIECESYVLLKPDAEILKCREQKGLDTPVVYADINGYFIDIFLSKIIDMINDMSILPGEYGRKVGILGR